ncbi:uncharacterized protein AB675_3438 [Cyphellophora attinorum]|uniref:Uncharacterized protein n=1 Tax=Cyphellophora attinorum TaxID=1664694 RepID=A0A0N1P048_9EURO|nr:uncharacterized protein AB675_3438 [Phialophora attinorum]KPI39794.1 hypothetical protein AB675_3438 [Phialophora attinorum]
MHHLASLAVLILSPFITHAQTWTGSVQDQYPIAGNVILFGVSGTPYNISAPNIWRELTRVEEKISFMYVDPVVKGEGISTECDFYETTGNETYYHLTHWHSQKGWTAPGPSDPDAPLDLQGYGHGAVGASRFPIVWAVRCEVWKVVYSAGAAT